MRSSSRCEEAWLALNNYGSSNVVVGITDDGCKLNHPDFDSLNKFGGWGYMRGTRLINSNDIDASPGQMYQPGANHGTSCASVAVSPDNVGVCGSAPAARLMPISGTGFDIEITEKMFNYCIDNGADIISCSWGTPERNFVLGDEDEIIQPRPDRWGQ